MAKNIVKDTATRVNIDITFGGAKTSGSVELIQEMPVLVLEDTDASYVAACSIPAAMVVELSVKGETTVNAAVAIGDKIYKDGSTYNRDSTNGVLIGYALGAVSSGATTTIPVALIG